MSVNRVLVTIGMPVYNGGELLCEALDSLLAQDYPNLELQISDNASTDGTEAICREYAVRDPRVRYSRNATNVGAIGNFKHVFELARGDFFMWASHDDRWSPGYVSGLVAALEASPSAMLATGWTRYVRADGSPVNPAAPPLGAFYPDSPAPAPFRSNADTSRSFLEQNACSWIYGLFRRDRIAQELPVLWRQRPWGGDTVFLLYLCLNFPVVGGENATIFKRVGSSSGSALRTKLDKLDWELWYAASLLGQVLRSPMKPFDRQRMMGAIARYLHRYFWREGVIKWFWRLIRIFPIWLARQAWRSLTRSGR